MTANVGSLDRALRIFIGLLLIALPFITGWGLWESAVLTYGAVIVGLVLVGTAATSFCPLYRLLGIRTCKV